MVPVEVKHEIKHEIDSGDAVQVGVTTRMQQRELSEQRCQEEAKELGNGPAPPVFPQLAPQPLPNEDLKLPAKTLLILQALRYQADCAVESRRHGEEKLLARLLDMVLQVLCKCVEVPSFTKSQQSQLVTMSMVLLKQRNRPTSRQLLESYYNHAVILNTGKTLGQKDTFVIVAYRIIGWTMELCFVESSLDVVGQTSCKAVVSLMMLLMREVIVPMRKL